MRNYDVIVIGAGSAGLPLATFAAKRGARICILDSAEEIGGSLLINRGQLSGAGTRLQADKGIHDTPDMHFDDAIRISRGTSDRRFLRMAVELQGPFIDWLMDNGFDIESDMPRIIHGHEAYRTARTYWGTQDGLSILHVIEPLFEAERRRGRIDLQLSTPVKQLVTGTAGEVLGVELEDGNQILGRRTVITSGGYGANPEIFARLHGGARLWSGSYHHARGIGIELAEQVGAEILHTEKLLPGFGGFLDKSLAHPRFRSFGGLTPQDRPPWEIIVNAEGQRFIAEDNPSVDERARLLFQQTDGRAWVVFDERIRREAPTLFSYWSQDRANAILADPECVAKAGSIVELASQAGTDSAGLNATISDYNAACGIQKDRLGRTHLPLPIVERPYYAVAIYSYSVRTVGGVSVDTDFRVLRRDGKAVENLYAAGEILGSLISGAGAVGGMSLTPALAFGKLLGERRLPL
ncbi:MAG: FAD-binding protein [Gammaproteobacteria bacterium]|nr:FAD-binding protein [Gammaproteobacteria bacterium]